MAWATAGMTSAGGRSPAASSTAAIGLKGGEALDEGGKQRLLAGKQPVQGGAGDARGGGEGRQDLLLGDR
jgi:hypothetical protein